MDSDKVLESRRSVRKYDATKQVTEKNIETIIEAAIQAPSWKNSQTARYYAVLDKDVQNKISDEALPAFNAKSSRGAALIITTFVKDRSGFDREGNPENECGNGWGYYDLGLHNANLILKAKDLGLDTLIMGIRDGDKIREILNIPENEIVVSVIAIGYSDSEASKPKRKRAEDILTII